MRGRLALRPRRWMMSRCRVQHSKDVPVPARQSRLWFERPGSSNSPGPGRSRLELSADSAARVLLAVDVHVVTVRVSRDLADQCGARGDATLGHENAAGRQRQDDIPGLAGDTDVNV